MDQKMGMVVLAIICGIILLVLLLRKRAQIILNFLVRTVLGAIMILLVNDILQKQGFDIYVGLNPVTLLTSGTLGFPGVALLYGIVILRIKYRIPTYPFPQILSTSPHINPHTISRLLIFMHCTSVTTAIDKNVSSVRFVIAPIHHLALL